MLFSFNLLGEGFDIAIHRIIDTLIGCGLAWFAVSYIWPDWKYRQLPLVIDRTMQANGRYLEQILQQYYNGKTDSPEYRVARRDAHISDGEFASVVANISSEPSSYRTSQDEAFRLLCLNHTLLSYISALGAHRTKLTDDTILRLLNDAIRYIETALQKDIGKICRFRLFQMRSHSVWINVPVTITAPSSWCWSRFACYSA